MFFNKVNAREAVRNLVLTAMFAACYVVFSRFFSIQTAYFKLGTSFIAIAMAAYLLGPIGAALAAGVGDFISAMLFMPGDYMPPITLTIMAMAAVQGILLRGMFRTDKIPLLARIITAVLITEIVGSILLNSYWIWIWFKIPKGYLAFAGARAIQSLIMAVVEVPVIYFLGKASVKVFSKVARR